MFVSVGLFYNCMADMAVAHIANRFLSNSQNKNNSRVMKTNAKTPLEQVQRLMSNLCLN